MMLRGFLFAAILVISSHVYAQGLRISTHVYDISKSDGRTPSQIVSSSLSLMHNGRVYDYVDSAEEVVIFDPVEKRFTILNEARSLSTRVTFDEIRHLMASREPKTKQYIQELLASEKPASRQLAESIQFQLKPSFSKTFDATRGTLMLKSPTMQYRVETRKWNDVEQVERYLAYADWTAAQRHPAPEQPVSRAPNGSERRDERVEGSHADQCGAGPSPCRTGSTSSRTSADSEGQ